MIGLLSKLLIKNHEAYNDAEVRKNYGVLCSATGIVLNVLLCIGKFIAGTVSGSIAITADAFNNLSDAGSSVITMIGFWFAGKKPDPEHPFGHGRIEYLSGLAVSMIILWMGIDLGRSSVEKLIHPEDVSGGILVSVILVISVLVKLYMYAYNHSTAKKIDSAAMEATAADSRSDALSTFVVFVSTLVCVYTGIHLDGICGIFVSLLIIKTGIESARDTVSPLLGQPPSHELVEQIEETVMTSDTIIGMHDLIVHDYGPGRLMISLHAEVPGNRDIFELHDEIDNMEFKLSQKFSCETVIHMDPIDVDDEAVGTMREAVAEAVKEIDPVITIHDFRMVSGTTHTNLIFDAVVPFSFRLDDAEVKKQIFQKVLEKFDNCYAVVKIDKSYT